MGYSISNRIFGSEIPGPIKQKLALRQAFSKGADVNEAINNVETRYDFDSDLNYAMNFNDVDRVINTADLSSRTPFVRMWVAVMLSSDNSPAKKSADFNTVNQMGKEIPEMPDEQRRKADWDEFKVVYFWKAGQIWYRTFSDTNTKIYTIGNNTLNTLSQLQPNESLTAEKSLLPDEQQSDSNEFFAPPAGITSVSSETEGPLGAIKKTSISFTIHNFADFETIYSRYFLRHGAQIFVDFGWDTQVDDLYRPDDFIFNELDNFEDDLFGEDGAVTKSYGDMDTIVGYVTNYDAKIKENGSVECTIDLSSKNTVLLDHNVAQDRALKQRIATGLDIEILRNAAASFTGGVEEIMVKKSANWSLSAADAKKWEEIFFDWASSDKYGLRTSAEKITPAGRAVQVGVYYGKLNKSKALFVSWGVLEDIILNPNFAFGDSGGYKSGEISDHSDKRMQPKFNSSYSFIRYDTNLLMSQQESTEISKLKWLYPDNWNDTYNTRRSGYLKDRIDDLDKLPGNYTPTSFDIDLHQIPLRELFVSTEMIKEALEGASSSLDFIRTICRTINSSTQEIFDFQLGTNKYSGSEISIIDRNIVQDPDDVDTFMKNIFTFQPMSPNTIVKSFDLSFTTPQGNLQNMIAIQSMPAGGQVFAVDGRLDRILSNEAVENTNEKDSNEKLIKRTAQYLPRVGPYRYKRLKQDTQPGGTALDYRSDSELFSGVESNVDNLLDSQSNPYSLPIMKKVNTAPEDPKEDTPSDSKAELILEETAGTAVAISMSEYYLMKAKSSILGSETSPIVYLTLTLGIYGISSLAPGDIFAVDYLPKKYRNQVYFQVQSISHDISSSTWTTTLECQMRLHKAMKQDIGMYQEIKTVVLSKSFLRSLGLSEEYGSGEEIAGEVPDATEGFKEGFTTEKLIQYVSSLTVVDSSKYKYLGDIFEFTVNRKATIFIPGTRLRHCDSDEPKWDPTGWFNRGMKSGHRAAGYAWVQNPNSHEEFTTYGQWDVKEDEVFYLIVNNAGHKGRLWTVARKGSKLEDFDYSVYGECITN